MADLAVSFPALWRLEGLFPKLLGGKQDHNFEDDES